MINLEKLKPSIATAIILSTSNFFTVILTFFLLDRNLFLSLNLWQLIGIGLGICCPMLIMNGMSTFEFEEKDNLEEREIKRWARSGFVTFFVTNTVLLISYKFSLSIAFNYWLIVALNSGMFIGSIFRPSRIFKKRQRN